MRTSLLLILSCLLFGSALSATPQEEAALRIAGLEKELESTNPRSVFRAVSRLAALGEPALAALEARAKALPMGRSRDYLELAAEEIRSAPLLAALPPIRTVTMKSADRNVIDLLGDLRTKTGAHISLDNLMDEEKLPEIAVDIRDATMLEAFDAICRAGNVSIAMDNGQFMLYPGQYLEVPHFFYGHYFFRLQEFELLKVVDFRKPAVQSFRITSELLWDPLAAPSKFYPPVVLEAVDDKGKSLLPPPAPPREPKKDGDEPPAEEEDAATIVLVPPSPGAQKISLLRGTVAIELPKTRVTAVFTAPTDGMTAKVGDLTFKITKIEGESLRLEAEVTPLDELKKIGNLTVLATVVLKGDEATRASAYPSWNENTLGLIVAYQPLHLKEVLVKPADEQQPSAPVEKLEISIVTSVYQRRIPFEFRDVKIK